MQPLNISSVQILPFSLPLKPLTVGGGALSAREGYYADVHTTNGLSVRGEIAPLPGVSTETLKKAKHDLEEIQAHLTGLSIPSEKEALIDFIRQDVRLAACCPSVRFGVESVFFGLAAAAKNARLAQFLESWWEMDSAVLLQGSHEQIISYAREMKSQGRSVFKLKVGDRNIPLDVKKVQSLREVIGPEGVIRLDANRAWKMEESVLFANLAGLTQIEFIEEPIKDMDHVQEFFQQTHMPVALDESLSMMRCAVNTPGRCAPAMTAQEAVSAYIVKPVILGGIVAALDWISEAKRLDKKAIISSAFESQVGLSVLKALAGLTGQPPGLDTQKYFV